jgi:hypothetical protein
MENDFEDGPEMQTAAEYAAQFANMFGSGPAGGGFGTLLKVSPDRPHGLLFWNGGDSVLNARPFVLTGQPNPNPNYSSNSYGGVWSGRPMFPGLHRQSKRDFVLLTYSGMTARSLVNSYGLVPTTLERGGRRISQCPEALRTAAASQGGVRTGSTSPTKSCPGQSSPRQTRSP